MLPVSLSGAGVKVASSADAYRVVGVVEKESNR